ncbi:MAG: tetratricopeptide repeat protein, partial [Deltaproteobacteria bacterium]|nr:tetratricopeptide repeat protein [Deltaproteobacteria bacterium]
MAKKEKLIEKAQKFIQKGYNDKAVVEYKKVLEMDPSDISIRLRLGDLYSKSGMKDEAIKEYEDVAKVNTKKGFYLKAIAVYKQILKLDETSLEVHNKLADLYAKQRLHSDARSEYSYIVGVYE